MKRRNRRLWSILVACFMILGVAAAGLPMTASAEDITPPEPVVGVMHVSHDLDGGAWKSGEEIGDYDIPYTLGDNIPASEFKHNSRTPERKGYTFAGWMYKFTNMDGIVLVEGEGKWATDQGPWTILNSDPLETKMLFTAVWEPVKTPKEEPTKPEPMKTEAGKVTPKTPKTGDNSPLALATLLLVGAGAATIGAARKSYLNK